MGDAINFGPAWLRKVASDSSTGAGSNHQNTSNSHNSHTLNSNSGTVVNNSGGGGGAGLHHHHPQHHHHSQQLPPTASSSSSHSSHHSHHLTHSSSGSALGGGGGGGVSGAVGSGFSTSPNEGGGGVANNGTEVTATTTTRYALAEFRYGREEMLALYEAIKTMKTPEILVNYKHLFVEKSEPPLSMTPGPEEELASEPDPRRIWPSRSISLGIPGRGARGGSVDRGRGRGRGVYTSYQRSTSFYDDESRGVGRGERPWLERNGTGAGGILGGGSGGDVEWNSSSSSPRKEYGSRIRSTGGGMESWRRSRTDDDGTSTSNGVGDWRSGVGGTGIGGIGATGMQREKWTRSTSWRDEDGSSHGIMERGLHSSSERMISVPSYRSRLSGGLGSNDLNSFSGGGMMRRPNWDADELPEWATENPSDFGGSFDASGAFHDSDNDGEGGGSAGGRCDGDDSNGGDNGGRVKSNHHQQVKPDERSKGGQREEPKSAASTGDGVETSSPTPGKNRGDAEELRTEAEIEPINHVDNSSEVGVKERNSRQKGHSADPTESSVQQRQKQDKDVGKTPKQREAVQGGTIRVLNTAAGKGPSSSRESIESSVSPGTGVVTGGDGDAKINSPAWQKGNEGSGTDAAAKGGARGNSIESNPKGRGNEHQSQREATQEPKKSPSVTSIDRMQEVADDMVAQLILDDEFLPPDATDPSVISSIAARGSVPVSSVQQHGAGLVDKSPVFGMSAGGPGSAGAASMTVVGAAAGIPMNMVLPKTLQAPMQQLFGNSNGGNLSRVNPMLLPDAVTVNRVAAAGVNPMSQLHHLMGPPPPPPGADVWYYRDPQGKVQGPFQAAEMTEWYRAGYFDDSLSVRRVCDDVYATLGSLVAICGGAIPFLNSMSIPPIKSNSGGGPAKHSPQQQPNASSQGEQPGKAASGTGSAGNILPSPNQQQQPAAQGGSHPNQSQQQQQAPIHPGQAGGGGPSGASVTGGGPGAGPSVPSQALHFIRQQNLLMQKLQSTDGWHLLSNEQQSFIVAQRMGQLMNSEGMVGLMSPSSLPVGGGAGGGQHQQQPGSSIFGGAAVPSQDTLVNMKLRELQQQQGQPPQQQQQFLKLNLPEFAQTPQGSGARPMLANMTVDPAAAAGHDPLGQLMHSIGFNHPPSVQNLGPMGPNNLMLNRGAMLGGAGAVASSQGPPQQQQQQQQPQQQPQSQQQQQQSHNPSHPTGKPSGGDDPIQSLLMQLTLHKNQPGQQLPPQHQQQPPSKSAGELMGTPWMQPTPGGIQQAQQQQPQPGMLPIGGTGSPMMGPAWGELPPQPPTSASYASLMQQQPHLAVAGHHPLLLGGPSNEPQAPSVVSLFKHHQQVEKQQQLEKEHILQQQQQQLLQKHHDGSLHAQQKHHHQQQPPHPQQLHEQQEQHMQQQLQQMQQQQQLQEQDQQFNQKQAKDAHKKEGVLDTAVQLQQQSSGAKKQSNKQQVSNSHADGDEKTAASTGVTQHNQKIKKQQKNMGGGSNSSSSSSNGQIVYEDESDFIKVKNEMEEKKRQKELKKQQQEEQKRKMAEEKKNLEEQEAQKKAKLLELQRREALKIQEQQQQQQQSPQQQCGASKTAPAPWSGAVAEIANSGLSLTEIQKAERELRAMMARREQNIREQQEQQQVLELQSQIDGKLKWNAHNLMPAKVKPLAEIQAEEAAAAERAREKNASSSSGSLTVAAVAAHGGSKSTKKEEPPTASALVGVVAGGAGAASGTAVWQMRSSSSSLYFNSSKAWGAGADNGESCNLSGSASSAGGMSNNVSSGGFWEEPTQPTLAATVAKGGNIARKQLANVNPASSGVAGVSGKHQHHQHHQQQQQLLSKSKTMGSISTSASSTVAAAKQQKQHQSSGMASGKGGPANAGKNAGGSGKNGTAAGGAGGASAGDRRDDRKNLNEQTNEFTSWCTRALSSLNSNVDIPTFVGFLQDIESPFEVKDYIRLYLGETKECSEFAKQFLERRSKYKNQQRQKNAHIDDMCKPAPAINPSSNDFQEIKGKGKKIKKNKMTKLDNRILGFSVTAAPDRLNVGDRDYGDNV